MDRKAAVRRPLCLLTTIMMIMTVESGSVIASVGSRTCPLSKCSLSPLECNMLASLSLEGSLTHCNMSDAAQDFGMLKSSPPAAVLHPGSTSDIVSIVAAVQNSISNLTIAARGQGHSIDGQSQALNGIVVEMSALKGIVVNSKEMFVEASAGEQWIDLLQATLQEGLTPKSFTDYLHLSVGGTLSNAGISGQAYIWGPQITNVLQLEVVTGTGAFVTCSRDVNSDLFFAVLGGLGQFGIITKARISLQPAKSNVRWLKAIYSDFTRFKRDQELLISNSSDGFDYVEGFVISNSGDPQNGYNSVPFPGTHQAVNPELMPSPASTPILYYIELAKYYNNSTESQLLIDEKISKLLAPLKFISTQVFSIDMSYFDFLERVYKTELLLRSLGKWDVPHPWLDILVPASKIEELDCAVFKRLNAESINGPLIIYPFNRNKWDARMSAQTPDEDMFYLVAFLPSVDLSLGPSLASMLSRNSAVIKYCQSLAGCKQYLPRYTTLADWKTHFGNNWITFLENKIKFDPRSILAPGQNIFARGKPLISLDG